VQISFPWVVVIPYPWCWAATATCKYKRKANVFFSDVILCAQGLTDPPFPSFRHQLRNEWGGSVYPIVPGHEIVGTVETVGGDVTKFKVGDKVSNGSVPA